LDYLVFIICDSMPPHKLHHGVKPGTLYLWPTPKGDSAAYDAWFKTQVQQAPTG
jgi:hypothetical protein